MEEKKPRYQNQQSIDEEEEKIKLYDQEIKDEKYKEACEIIKNNTNHLYVSLLDTVDPNVLKVNFTAFVCNPAKSNKRNIQKVIESEEVDITCFNLPDSLVTSEDYLQIEKMALSRYEEAYKEKLLLFPRCKFLVHNLNGASCIVAEEKKLLDDVISKYGKPTASRRFTIVPLTELRFFFQCSNVFIKRHIEEVLLSYFFAEGERSSSFSTCRTFQGGELMQLPLETASYDNNMKFAILMLSYSNTKYDITFPGARRFLGESTLACAYRGLENEFKDEKGLFCLQNMTMNNPHHVDIGDTRVFCLKLYP